MKAHRVRFGVNLMPQLWVDGPVKSGAALMNHRSRLLRRMADGGLDHVMVGDHVMFHGGVGNDGLTDAASVVTATDELGVYLAVYLLVLRHPLLVARQILTVAQFAPGRLALGLGIGGDDRREVVASGVDPATRGRRMDESLSPTSPAGADRHPRQPYRNSRIPLVVGGDELRWAGGPTG
jgi:hypothetical protein